MLILTKDGKRIKNGVVQGGKSRADKRGCKGCGETLLKAVKESSLPRISSTVVIPCQNEGDWINKTLDGYYAAGIEKAIVIDDASEDGCCSSLRNGKRLVILRNEKMRGPGMARLQGIERVETDVCILSDAHVLVPSTFGEFARQSARLDCFLSATMLGMGDRSAEGYGGNLEWSLEEVGCLVVKYWGWPKGRFEKRRGIIGACYALPMKVYKRMAGWPFTTSWGYNEQGMTLMAFFSGVPMMNDNKTVVRHFCKKRFFKDADKIYLNSRINRMLVHYQMFSTETWERFFLPHHKVTFSKHPEIIKDALTIIRGEEMQLRRRVFQKGKKKSDLEFFQAGTWLGGIPRVKNLKDRYTPSLWE